jgi:hypothetical protein
VKCFPIYLLSLCLFACSCKQRASQSANEKNILGDWVQVRNPVPLNKRDLVLELFDFSRSGFSFYANHTFDNRRGYIKRTDSASLFLGTLSKYDIKADTLKLLNLDSNKWENYKIVKLTRDSLQFIEDDRLATFKHCDIKQHFNLSFDKIILSTSGCYGSCPIMSIILNNDGSVFFRGIKYTNKKGIFTGTITKEDFNLLQRGFLTTNIDSLKNKYVAGWTDDETISTNFVKDGKIYKTIDDYGRTAPFQFTWAYNQVRYLYQKIALKTVSPPKVVKYFNYVKYSSFRANKKIAELTESETSLLFDYIRNGKPSTVKFKPRFKLNIGLGYFKHMEFETDGRYYKFMINNKPNVVDIGFNFYDVNERHWQWRNINEYD